jgi:hypothetical protein
VLKHITTPPRRGRPPIVADDPKTDLFRFRISPRERVVLEAWASRQGISLSDAVRSLALAAARGRLGELTLAGEVIS